jgi:cysteine desulfurase
MQIYLDNNATTQPPEEVIEAACQAMREHWGNPSSVHRLGQQAKHCIELAREKICALLHCRERELVFTSGATESNNAAMIGLLEARTPRKTIFTTGIEHSAIREPCVRLAERGYNLVILPVDTSGLVDLDALHDALTKHGDDVAFVSIHYINNEIGVIQPLEQIGNICRDAGVPYFSDMTQAVGKVPINLNSLPVDVASFASHKFHGPKGSGGLYIRSRFKIVPQQIGGPHERDRRAGTENTPGIAGMGVAADLAQKFLASSGPKRCEALRDKLERGLLEAYEGAVVNAADAPRIWNTCNIAFPPLLSEAILILLSEKGICAAAGSACSSGSMEPSTVLAQMGVPREVAMASLRLSLCRYTTEQEIDTALQIIPTTLERVQSSMPANA